MFGVSPAMAWRISEQGYEPKDAKIRLLLGLSAMGEAPVCPYCGEVHVARGCPVRRRRHVRSLFDVSRMARMDAKGATDGHGMARMV